MTQQSYNTPILITKAAYTASMQHHLADRGPRYAGTPCQQCSAPKPWHEREGCWISASAPTPATQPSVYLYSPPTRSGTSDLLLFPHVPFPTASNMQAIFSHDRVWRDRCGGRQVGKNCPAAHSHSSMMGADGEKDCTKHNCSFLAAGAAH